MSICYFCPGFNSLQMTIPLTVLRFMFEEKYAEMVIDGSIQSVDPHNYDAMTQAILKRSADIIELTNDPKLCAQESGAFVICLQMHPAYADAVLVRYHMKQLYIQMLVDGYDPDDPNFRGTFAKRAIEYKPIIERFKPVDEDDMRYKLHRIEQITQEFLEKVNSGKISVPVTKPYLNYLPTPRARSILLKHISS